MGQKKSLPESCVYNKHRNTHTHIYITSIYVGTHVYFYTFMYTYLHTHTRTYIYKHILVGSAKLIGDNLKFVRAEFSTLS